MGWGKSRVRLQVHTEILRRGFRGTCRDASHTSRIRNRHVVFRGPVEEVHAFSVYATNTAQLDRHEQTNGIRRSFARSWAARNEAVGIRKSG